MTNYKSGSFIPLKLLRLVFSSLQADLFRDVRNDLSKRILKNMLNCSFIRSKFKISLGLYLKGHGENVEKMFYENTEIM